MPFTPAYLTIPRNTLQDKVATAQEVLRACTLCPRECGVDRTSGEVGFCRTGNVPFVASWGTHFGEERPLVGPFAFRGGSGTIFFSNCNLGCVFCQNWTISHMGEGREISHERLAEIMLGLQRDGCHNINLVTPTHQVPMILRSLVLAADRGLRLPVVYNCGGFESVATLRILDNVIDIYMPDFKYADTEAARRYSGVEDYPARAKEAIREMHRQVGDLRMDERGIALRGLLVRHLVLPGGLAGTGDVVRFLAEEISRDTYVNIMDQYRPCFHASEHSPLDRSITAAEYERAIDMAKAAGLRRIDGVTI